MRRNASRDVAAARTVDAAPRLPLANRVNVGVRRRAEARGTGAVRAFGDVGEVVEGPLEQAVRIVSVDAVFDAASAARMIARLAAMGCARVALDFGRAREVSDAALAMVAYAVARKECPQVSLRGLGQHQERILRYLGVERVASRGTRGRAQRRRSGGTT